MAKLFGTDGIRGLANQDPVTPEMGLRLGRAIVCFCKERGNNLGIVIGRDTRKSGRMLEYSVISGIISAGGNSLQAGVVPTPAVAYLTKKLAAGAGIVISASHNPHEYNGFKIFTNEGYKPFDNLELRIEALMLSPDNLSFSQKRSADLGSVEVLNKAVEEYVSFLRNTFPKKISLKGVKVVLDCANGATYQAGPALFTMLDADTQALFVHPDGKNINQDCGSEHPEALKQKVLETGADIGLAFDGDGDRLTAVDERGNVLTGDQILTICAKMLKKQGRLKENLVVSTVMSNMGFRVALKDLDIKQISTPVGDRHVVEEMKARHAVLGGENSGHIIFLNHHTTGDGLLSALQLLFAIKDLEQPISKLSDLMTVFPQTLINVPVKIKPDISRVPELIRIIKKVEKELGEKGRVLVRYSGTEPLCRVMVEGEKKEEIEAYANEIGQVVRSKLAHSNSSDSSVG